jgi:hypothetical protein
MKIKTVREVQPTVVRRKAGTNTEPDKEAKLLINKSTDKKESYLVGKKPIYEKG